MLRGSDIGGSVMMTFVINLDRCPERLSTFRERNGHAADVKRFPAVDGRRLSPSALIEKGVVLVDHHYTRNAIGSALSHMSLWERAAAMDEPVCVIEDDAILSAAFARHLRGLSETRAAWDYVAWGWNFDAPLLVDLIPGVSPARIECSQPHLRRGVDAFRTSDLDSRLYRLISHHGILCYSISPRGARALLRACSPLGPGARTIDQAMNRHYAALRAYVACPPTAISENDHAASTILHA